MDRGWILGRAALIFWLLMIVVTYTVFEFGVRIFAPKVTEVTEELDRAIIEINNKHGSISKYIAEQKLPKDNGPHLHPVLGWDPRL